MGNNFIFVEGGIYAESGSHIAKEISCLNDIRDAAKADKVIHGDLNLDDETTLIPYCSYMASEGIAVCCGSLRTFNSPSILRNLYSEEVDKIMRLLKIEVPDDLKQVHLKSLFGAVFGNFELFITSLLHVMIFGCKDYYDRFLLYTNKVNYEKKDVYSKLFSEHIGKITTHNLNKIKNVFENVFEISFPDVSDLGREVKTRHDIIHRSGNTIKGINMHKIELNCNDIERLISKCDLFIDNLMDAMKLPIEKWK